MLTFPQHVPEQGDLVQCYGFASSRAVISATATLAILPKGNLFDSRTQIKVPAIAPASFAHG